MKIKGLKIGGILSFGPEQCFDNFTNYNLFIGPNGSGKSNIFQVLNGLPFDMKTVQLREGICLYKPVFLELSNWAVNDDSKVGEIPKSLQIDYQSIESISPGGVVQKQILFQENANGFLDLKYGDVLHYERSVSKIDIPETELDFFKDLTLATQNIPYFTTVINFGLYYVFGIHYRFIEGGLFIQGRLSGNGTVEHQTDKLPSGVAQFSKCMTRILMSTNSQVLLIDEPEVHLEPRFVRRFFEFVIWWCVRSKDCSSDKELDISGLVDAVLEKNAINDSEYIWGVMPKKFGNTLQGKQLFVASHSPILINQFLRLGEEGSIYEFRLEESEYVLNSFYQNTGQDNTRVGLFSEVRKVDSLHAGILDGIGSTGADILQCNGVIWVEGPSDVIYIQKWLSLYARKYGLEVLMVGTLNLLQFNGYIK